MTALDCIEQCHAMHLYWVHQAVLSKGKERQTYDAMARAARMIEAKLEAMQRVDR